MNIECVMQFDVNIVVFIQLSIVDGSIEDCYFGYNDSPDVKYLGDYEAMKASYYEHIIMNMIIFPDLVTESPSTFY